MTVIEYREPLNRPHSRPVPAIRVLRTYMSTSWSLVREHLRNNLNRQQNAFFLKKILVPSCQNIVQTIMTFRTNGIFEFIENLVREDRSHLASALKCLRVLENIHRVQTNFAPSPCSHEFYKSFRKISYFFRPSIKGPNINSEVGSSAEEDSCSPRIVTAEEILDV